MIAGTARSMEMSVEEQLVLRGLSTNVGEDIPAITTRRIIYMKRGKNTQRLQKQLTVQIYTTQQRPFL